jgi:hypothetical protein
MTPLEDQVWRAVGIGWGKPVLTPRDTAQFEAIVREVVKAFTPIAAVNAELLAALIDVAENYTIDNPQMWERVHAAINKAKAEGKDATGALIDQYVHMMDLRLIAEAPGTRQPVRYPTLTEQRAAIERLAAVNAELLAALKDITSGWRYIRRVHGDLPGVGWSRAQTAAEAAIARAEGKDAT